MKHFSPKEAISSNKRSKYF